jgi:protease I
MTPNDLTKKSVAFLVANEGVEQVELTTPWAAVRDAGANPVLLAPEAGVVQAFNHLDKAETFPVDQSLDVADPASFDLLVLPGGVANPDQLRMSPAAVTFVKTYVESGKPVAAICHAPWTLIEADVVRGRTVTSWPSVQTDLRNAGARWVDDELVICDNGPGLLVTSRKPDDLPAFSKKVVDLLS